MINSQTCDLSIVMSLTLLPHYSTKCTHRGKPYPTFTTLQYQAAGMSTRSSFSFVVKAKAKDFHAVLKDMTIPMPRTNISLKYGLPRSINKVIDDRDIINISSQSPIVIKAAPSVAR